MKILIINPYGIGDVLFTTPLVSWLRQSFPQASIAYLANKRTADFLRVNPDIGQVFVYDRDEFAAIGRRRPLKFIQQWFDFIKRIRQEAFHVVFDLSLNSTFGFVSVVAGIEKRIGYDYRGRGLFLTDKIPLKAFEEKHIVEYYLDLLQKLPLPGGRQHQAIHAPLSMPLRPPDIQWAKDWLSQQGFDHTKPLIALVPGGGLSWGKAAGLKRWPASSYADLAHKIIEKLDAAIILMGDSLDRSTSLLVAKGAHVPLYSAVGKTSVLQMAALFKQCRLVVVNDGGPLHVAVAAGVKTVSIFGPVDPKVYGPYPAQGHGIVEKKCACQPCYRRFRMAICAHQMCLRDLSVEKVYQKVQEAFV